MIRDEEIKKLIFYAKSLGAKINIRNYAFEHEAEVVFSAKYTININKHRHRNKTQLIFSLMHEIAHLKYIALNNYKFSDAFLEEVWALEEQGKKIPKKYRKDIVKFELDSLGLMVNIASEIGVKVPMWKVLRTMEHDKYFYKVLGETGYFPTLEESNKEWKRLTERYKE